MSTRGASEGLDIISVFRGLLEGWDKHCGTLKALSDQIMAMDRCEKDVINVPQDIFTDVRVTIQNKITEEIHSLSQLLANMEEQHSAMIAVVADVASSCQHVLEKRERNSGNLDRHTNQLHTLQSLCTCIALIIGMKRVPLLSVDPENFSSLQDFKEANTACKTLVTELDRAVASLESLK